MTTTSVPSPDRPPANAAQVGTVLLDLGHLLVKYPRLEVSLVQVAHFYKPAPPRVHLALDATSPEHRIEIEAVVSDRKIDSFAGTGSQRVAKWVGTLEGVDVEFVRPAPEPEPPADALLVCADCPLEDPFRAASSPVGVANFFEHVKTHRQAAVGRAHLEAAAS